MSQQSTSRSINNKVNGTENNRTTNSRRGIGNNDKFAAEISTRLKNFRKSMANSISQFAKNSTEPEDSEYNVFASILSSNVTPIFDIDDEESDDVNVNPIDEMQEGNDTSKAVNRQVKKELVTSSTSNMIMAEPEPLVELPCSSSFPLPTAAPAETNAAAPFASRIRKTHHSQPIDMGQRYELLGVRYFQGIQGTDVGINGYQPVELSVVTFNVLCQSSLEQTRHLYRHLYGQRINNLRWDIRLSKLQSEFDRLSADVFCLQEIQDCHFEQFFKPYFYQRGYEGLFQRRTGQPPDGCAIFWRSHRLELLKSRSIAYNLNVPGMNRDNVGQICIFGIRGFGTAICISNTHIYFNMKKGDVKLAQIAYLLASMDQMEKEFVAEQNCSNPIAASNVDKRTASNSKSHHPYVHFAGHILCGDFNVYPSSPLHRFLLDRQINLRASTQDLAVTMEMGVKRRQRTLLNFMDGPLQRPLPIPFDRMGIFGGNCSFGGFKKGRIKKENYTGNRMDLPCTELCHEFKFVSVYEHWNILCEPELSSYHVDPIQPDYIFYTVSATRKDQKQQKKRMNDNANGNVNMAADLASENFIQLWRRLSLPTRQQFDLAGGPLPNEQYGSDHLSLWAGFRILCLPIVPPEINQPPPKQATNANRKKRKNRWQNDV